MWIFEEISLIPLDASFMGCLTPSDGVFVKGMGQIGEVFSGRFPLNTEFGTDGVFVNMSLCRRTTVPIFDNSSFVLSFVEE